MNFDTRIVAHNTPAVTNITDTFTGDLVTQGSMATVVVDRAGDTADFNDVISGNALTKNGPGLMVMSGTADNTLNGNVTVLAGELDLNKTGSGVVAIPGPGALIIGDPAQTNVLATVKLTGQSNEIDSAVNVTTWGP